MPIDRPTSLVTGASAGIGAAFARALAAKGHDLVLTARRADRLEALAAELRERHGGAVAVIPCDLEAPDAVVHLTGEIAARGIAIDWLVNNAGYGTPGAFDASAWEVHAAFLRIMVGAPSELIHRLLPAMRARGYGRIVNVASLAGHVPGSAGHTLYPAVKSYLIKLSQSLAQENADRGVHVLALCPGFTRSEFHDVTGTRAIMDRLPGYMWQTAEAVVAEALAAIETGDPVRVTGRINRAIKTMFKLLPDRLALKLIARQAKRFRNMERNE